MKLVIYMMFNIYFYIASMSMAKKIAIALSIILIISISIVREDVNSCETSDGCLNAAYNYGGFVSGYSRGQENAHVTFEEYNFHIRPELSSSARIGPSDVAMMVHWPYNRPTEGRIIWRASRQYDRRAIHVYFSQSDDNIGMISMRLPKNFIDMGLAVPRCATDDDEYIYAGHPTLYSQESEMFFRCRKRVLSSQMRCGIDAPGMNPLCTIRTSISGNIDAQISFSKTLISESEDIEDAMLSLFLDNSVKTSP